MKLDKKNIYIFSLTDDFKDSGDMIDVVDTTTEIYLIYKNFKFRIDSNLIVTFIDDRIPNITPEKQLEKSSLVLLEHFDNNNGVIINSDRITTDEKKIGNGSLYLNDTAIDDNYTRQFEFTDDFTVEYWIKLGRENLNYEWAIHLAVYADNGIYLGLSNGKYIVRGWNIQTYLTLDAPPMEEWVHIAVSRKNGILKVFYNGILQGSVANTTNFSNGRLCIGYEGTSLYCKNSYIDELKISPNDGKYENNFNIQDSITYSDDIIYHFENEDRLYNSFAKQSTTEKKFGKSSYYFDNSYVTYKEKEGFQLSGDFTIDYWIKETSEALNKEHYIHMTIPNNNGIYLGLNNGKYIVRGWNIQTYLTLNPPPMNEWVHIAVTRKDGILYVFYNGILQGQTENLTQFSKGNFCIGYEGTGFFATHMYIDELRILNGYCQWTENFTVPYNSYEY